MGGSKALFWLAYKQKHFLRRIGSIKIINVRTLKANSSPPGIYAKGVFT